MQTLRYFNNTPTLQHFDARTLPHFNTSTLQRFNASKLILFLKTMNFQLSPSLINELMKTQAFARNIRTSKGSYFGLTSAENKLFRLHDILNDMHGEVRPSTSAEASALAATFFARRDAHIHKSPNPDYVFGTEPIPEDNLNVTAKFFLRTRKYAPQLKKIVPMADDLDNYKETGRAGLPDHIPVSDWDHGVDMDARMSLRFNIPALEMGRFKRGSDPIDKNAFVTRMYRNMIKSSVMQNPLKDQKRHLPPDVPEGVIEFDIDSFKGKKFQPGIERIKDRKFNQSILGFIATSRENKEKTEQLKQQMREGKALNMPRLDRSGFHMPSTSFEENAVTLVNSKPVYKKLYDESPSIARPRVRLEEDYDQELVATVANPVENVDAGNFPDYFRRSSSSIPTIKI